MLMRPLVCVFWMPKMAEILVEDLMTNIDVAM